jgi:hypothetical protein
MCYGAYGQLTAHVQPLYYSLLLFLLRLDVLEVIVCY